MLARKKYYALFAGFVSFFLYVHPVHATQSRTLGKEAHPSALQEIRSELDTIFEEARDQFNADYIRMWSGSENAIQFFLKLSTSQQIKMYKTLAERAFLSHYIHKMHKGKLNALKVRLADVSDIKHQYLFNTDGDFDTQMDSIFLGRMKDSVGNIVLQTRVAAMLKSGVFLSLGSAPSPSIIDKYDTGGVIVGVGWICLLLLWAYDFFQKQLAPGNLSTEKIA